MTDEQLTSIYNESFDLWLALSSIGRDPKSLRDADDELLRHYEEGLKRYAVLHAAITVEILTRNAPFKVPGGTLHPTADREDFRLVPDGPGPDALALATGRKKYRAAQLTKARAN